MQHADHTAERVSAIAFPPVARLTEYAVGMPVVVAATNYALMFGHVSAPWPFLFAWMAVSTAALSWCVGRYLWPAWLRWLVLAWALVLLDLLTFATCIGTSYSGFGYALVTAQIGFLVLWAILGPERWQLRLPAAVVAAAIVMGFSGSFDDRWSSRAWNVMLFLTAVELTLLCGGLRCFGYSLKRAADDGPVSSGGHDNAVYQFGTRHMLVWATAIAPLLLVARGLDFVFADVFDAQSIVSAVVLVVSLATVCLIAIWAVLGAGSLIARTISLILMPFVLGIVMRVVSEPRRTRWRSPILAGIDDVGDNWITWMGLTAALLAALLLFLRADGYLLSRAKSLDTS
jgi:hypothetical protein